MAVLVTPMGGRLSGDKPSGTDYEQLVNYTMTYDGGDECSEVHGGWVKSYTDSSTVVEGVDTSCVATKNKDNLYLKNTDTGSTAQCFITKNKFDISDFNKLIIKYTSTSSSSSTSGRMRLAKVPYTENYWTSANRLTDTDLPLGSNLICEVDVEGINEQASLYVSAISKCSAELTVYDIFFVKPDNYTKLCELANVTAPSTLEALLADTTSLATIFNNEEAVKFMVKQCTGDFMVGVLNNETAVGLLKESPYLNMVVANPHWAKFMMMLPTANELLNYTMLYDEGNECEEVTGGLEDVASSSSARVLWTRNTDNLYVSCSGTSKFAVIQTVNKVGIADCNKVYVKASQTTSNNNSFIIGVRSTPPSQALSDPRTFDVKRVNFSRAINSEVLVADISDLAEDNYLGIGTGTGSIGGTVTATIYNVFLTKADNFQKWAEFGGITATDLDTLVNDATAMATLMSNQKAVDYLAGCTGDLMVAICNSEVAMSALCDNIAYDTLFKHPVWRKFMLMCPTSLEAMKSAPTTVSIPTMTSNTAPSGVASASHSDTANPPYKAFDKDEVNTCWYHIGTTTALSRNLQYEFEEPLELFLIEHMIGYGSTASGFTGTQAGTIQASLDGSTWEDIATFSHVAKTTLAMQDVPLERPVKVKYIRLVFSSAYTYEGKYITACGELNAYGKAVSE